ncbi:MAG TPA: colanic acid biosynthesis glycosyltransferase WcaI [Opitutae bacterium]|nr:colanic acid biosynthesis glycosyltransferase WcaI [Opitutae bacterium]
MNPTSEQNTGKLRIHLWGINYAPEVVGIAVYNTMLAEWLAARGHRVNVVSAFPYYPEWKKLPGDTGRLYRVEESEGLTLHRCWHYVPEQATALGRILHEASFVFTSLFRIMTLPKADAAIVVSPPLLLGAAAWLFRLFRRTPFIFHVQDLQPDAAVALGMIERRRILDLLYALETFTYAKADRLSGIAPGMLEAFAIKGVDKEKTIFFPNAVGISKNQTQIRDSSRDGFGAEKCEFRVIYSGNLGVKQGLNSVLEAIALIRRPDIRFVICGDGARRKELESKAAELGLHQVYFSDLLPQADYERLLASADICLVPQAKGSGAAFLPSKLLSILATPKPVLAISDASSEVSRTVKMGNFGIVVEPNAPQKLAALIESLPEQTDQLNRWAENGRDYVAQFAVDTVHQSFERQLELLARQHAPTLKDLPPLQSKPTKQSSTVWFFRVAAGLLTASLIYYSFKADPQFAGDPFLPAWLERLGDHYPDARTLAPYALYSSILPFLGRDYRRQLSIRILALGSVLLFAFLILSELLQLALPTRYFSAYDLIWGSFGIIIGALVGILLWLWVIRSS